MTSSNKWSYFVQMSVTAEVRAVNAFRARGGQMRMSEVIGRGICRSALYSLVRRGDILRCARGVYRLADAEPELHHSLATAALLHPQSVVCLISALAYHEITTRIPAAVTLAMPRGSRAPCSGSPPVRVHLFSGAAFTEGIETHTIDGVPVKVYCKEKTIADCFKLRTKVGLDVAMEALKHYFWQTPDVGKLMHYARVCRVERVMSPYVQTEAHRT